MSDPWHKPASYADADGRGGDRSERGFDGKVVVEGNKLNLTDDG